MGAFMMECDNQIPYLLDNMNIRFGMPDGVGEDMFGGIFELAKMHQAYGIFKKGRKLGDIINLLGLAGFENPRAHHRWVLLLDKLQNQDEIIDRIIGNLEAKMPMPMYFRPAADTGKFVATFSKGKPLPYSLVDYLIMDIPMKPRDLRKEKEEREKKEQKGGKKA